MNNSFPTNIAKSQGFSLIEILVSLVVLSVGLMGLGGLQLAALKGSNEAHYRTEASLLMMDFSDRMRSNVDGVGLGSYLISGANQQNCSTTPLPNCETTSCNASQLAIFDIHRITCSIRDLLPNGELKIDCAPSVNCTAIQLADNRVLNKTHNLNISWKEAKNKKEDTSDGKTYHLREINLSIVP